MRNLPACASLCLLGFLLGMPAAAQLPETELASRLSADAAEFLSRMVGPGRSKVFVVVEGRPVQGGAFETTKILVSVVLDARLPDAKVQEVRRLTPDFLRMDPERGDDLAILRAPLVPLWKAAFLDQDGARSALRIGAAVMTGLLFCLTLYLTGIGAMRALAREAQALRYAGAAAPGAFPRAAEEPLLLSGEIPGLAEEAPSGAGPPALGRRFEFLSGKEPAELAPALEAEPAGELALLFAHLAGSRSELAARLFSALPVPKQTSVSEILVKLKAADPERLAALEVRLKAAVEQSVQGSETLGRILSRLPPAQREVLLGELLSRDREGAEAAEASMFTFEGLAGLKPEDLRRLIVSVPFQDWSAALRSAPSELVERILAELPQGARAMVQEALQAAQPRDKVLCARSKILAQADALASEGQIVLQRPGAGPELL
ncbi:MAG: hypothetical protein HY922_04290 [Elusimicrobia bacterium]|nr:hypothetical protein [Elusimicrobiota bacterium]